MNRQRIRDVTFAKICDHCGYGAQGRQLGNQITYVGGLEDQIDYCPTLQRDMMAECMHWRRAETIVKPE